MDAATRGALTLEPGRRTSLLQQVWPTVREVVIDQLDAVDDAALALLTPGASCAAADAARMAHRLAGSLGSFGVPAASDYAYELERLLDGVAGGDHDPSTTLRVAQLAVELREVVASVEATFETPDLPAVSAPPAAPTVIDLRIIDVAIVEDDPVTAELIVQTLRQQGLTVKLLRDGREATASLGGPIPDVRARVILLDVDLPEIDGLDVLRHLRSSGALDGTRVIMVTARSGESETLDAFDLGASDHIAKPFSTGVLSRRVKLALGR